MRSRPVTADLLTFRPIPRAVVAPLLLLATACASGQAPLSIHALKVKSELERLHPGDKISIIPRNAPEIFATLTVAGVDSFDCQDVDEHIPRHLTFEEVKKVKAGYGGYNNLHHRHTDRTVGRIVLISVLAGLTLLIIAAAAAQ